MLIDLSEIRKQHLTAEAAAKSWKIDAGMNIHDLSRSRIYLVDAKGRPEKMTALLEGWDTGVSQIPPHIDALSLGALPILALRNNPNDPEIINKAFSVALEHIRATQSFRLMGTKMRRQGLQMVLVAKVDNLHDLKARLVIIPSPILLSAIEVTNIAKMVEF